MRRRNRTQPVALARLAAIAVVPTVVMAGVWQYADANVPATTTTTTTTVPPPPDVELVTDLLSMRRHPTPVAERAARTAADAAFAARIDALEDDVGDTSCLRIVDGSEVIAALGTEGPVIPASNQKLFVAAVALAILGPDHRFRTDLLSVRPVDGVITEDVYLVGGGDPVLTTAGVDDPLRYPAFNTTSLDALADRLVTLGITRIQGDIVGDGSRYDDEFRAPSWGDEITSIDAGPYDALLVNDGLISPGNYGLDPSRAAARAFTDLLTARGIVIEGAAANATRPADAQFTTLAFVESRPLTDIVVELLHTSDNNTAEMLVKEIGFVATGEGSRATGLEVIRTTLAAWGVPLDGVEFHDGSGLSRSNRTTCAALTALLADVPVADMLRDVMPVAGRDGTLAEQFLGTEAEGRLQAKTGTLADVKALTGTQPGADRRAVDFALVLNGEGVDDLATYEPIWRRLVALVDEYPVVVEPDPDRFGPRRADEEPDVA
jgi:D-alanyl-D-alanine carboxypeptidase/D-alanyl-D-alanine-endopeptidase (penicillin-binding protein 4)